MQSGSDHGYRNSPWSLTHARMNTLLTQSSPCEVRHRLRWRLMSGRSCSRATRVFFDRDADPAKEPAHHRGVGFDPSLGRKAIAEGLKRDVRFLGPRGFQKIPVRHQLGGAMAAVSSDGGSRRAIPFNALKPF